MEVPSTSASRFVVGDGCEIPRDTHSSRRRSRAARTKLRGPILGRAAAIARKIVCGILREARNLRGGVVIHLARKWLSRRPTRRNRKITALWRVRRCRRCLASGLFGESPRERGSVVMDDDPFTAHAPHHQSEIPSDGLGALQLPTTENQRRPGRYFADLQLRERQFAHRLAGRVLLDVTIESGLPTSGCVASGTESEVRRVPVRVHELGNVAGVPCVGLSFQNVADFGLRGPAFTSRRATATGGQRGVCGPTNDKPDSSHDSEEHTAKGGPREGWHRGSETPAQAATACGELTVEARGVREGPPLIGSRKAKSVTTCHFSRESHFRG